MANDSAVRAHAYAPPTAPDTPHAPESGPRRGDPYPPELVLSAVSRWPTTLPQATVQAVLGEGRPVGRARFAVLALGLRGEDAPARALQPLLDQYAQHGHRVFRPDSPDLAALAAWRQAERIHTAVVYFADPAWLPLAEQARESWGWPLVYAGALPPALSAEERHRLESARRPSFPLVSIVVVTFNNVVYTKLCLESLLATTEYPHYELIVVDNASTDETPAYLRHLAGQYPHISVLCNAENRGFAGANNQGLERARGDVLVLLNNDTLLTPGWLTRLVRHLRTPDVGAVGPVTNATPNEAQIEATYNTYGALLDFAADHTWAHDGETFEIERLMMFCLAMRRDVYTRLGPLDERFGVGMLEDLDYSLRLHAAGYRTLCAEDVFIHHYSEASFGMLAASGEFLALWWANCARLEEKWKVPWTRARQRPQPQYEALVARVRALVDRRLPAETIVVVAARGDEKLLRLGGRQGWAFPPAHESGRIDFYPEDSATAIAQLEAQRAQGAEFLLLPANAFWWLARLDAFKRHLESRYPLFARAEETGLIFALQDPMTSEPLDPEACRITLTAQLPAVLEVEDQVEAECVLHNRGTAILASVPPGVVYIAYRWLDPASGEQIDGLQALSAKLSRPVAPGETVRCRFWLNAPPRAGTFGVRLTLMQAGGAWFDDLDSANAYTGSIRIVRVAHTQIPAQAHQIRLQAALPAEVEAGTVVELDCLVENRGSMALASTLPFPVFISYRWIVPGTGGRSAPDSEGVRSPLPQPLVPGEPLACRFTLQAPPRAGTYLLRISLVQKGGTWFDKLDLANGCARQVHVRPPAGAT